MIMEKVARKLALNAAMMLKEHSWKSSSSSQ